MLLSLYELIRILDQYQDAGLLDNIPAAPEDNLDFNVGNDDYMLEHCQCGASTCLEWHAFSVTNSYGPDDFDFDLIITLAIRAKNQGCQRFSQYLLRSHTFASQMLYHIRGVKDDDLSDFCKAYDPLVVVLALSMLTREEEGDGGYQNDLPLEYPPPPGHLIQ